MLPRKLAPETLLALTCILGAVTLMQHVDLGKLRTENAASRKEIEELSRASRENAELRVRPSGSDADPENASAELLRLRGEVSLLRRELADARSGPSQVASGELRRQGFQRALEVLESRFSEEQQRVILARQKLQELEATLGVPENITNLDLTSSLNDPSLKQYQPYFVAKEELKSFESAGLLLLTALTYVRTDSQLPVSSPSSP